MSRTEEDIQSRVDITIMRYPTLRAYPTSYSEVCDTFRSRLARARRTDSGRERFVDLLVPSSVRSRFVAEHLSEGGPAGVENRLRQAGLGESGGVHIADCDVIKLSNNTRGELVVKVTSRIDYARVKVGRLTSFAGALRESKSVGQPPQMLRIVDLLSVGESCEVFKTQIDADTASHGPPIRLRNVNDDIQEPMTACIAGEVRSVPDLAFRQRPRVEHPKGVSREAKGYSLTLEVASFQGHPAQRTLASPPQEWAVPLKPRLGVLLANGIDRAGVQGEFLAAPSRQPIQIEAAGPALVPFQRLMLSLVAIIPNEVTGSRLSVQQAGQGFDAVSIGQQHGPKLVHLKDMGKGLNLGEMSIFTPPFPKHKAVA